MKRKGVADLPAVHRLVPAANEEFAGMADGLDASVRPSGWDPYEVWRTRVKNPSAVTQERERDPLR